MLHKALLFFFKQKHVTPSLFIDIAPLVEFCNRIHLQIPLCTKIHRKACNILQVFKNCIDYFIDIISQELLL